MDGSELDSSNDEEEWNSDSSRYEVFMIITNYCGVSPQICLNLFRVPDKRVFPNRQCYDRDRNIDFNVQTFCCLRWQSPTHLVPQAG